MTDEQPVTVEYAIKHTPPSSATRARRDEAILRYDSIGKGGRSASGGKKTYRDKLKRLAKKAGKKAGQA